MPKPILLKNATLVTMNQNREILKADLLIEKNKIKKIAKRISNNNNTFKQVDCTDCFITPGFIQSHIHLCQTLLRGEADDMALLDWLSKKVWPMEAAHNRASIKSSAEIAICEMLLSGTTSILDMATVQHTNALLETVEKSGLRYWGGKCLMDNKELSGPLYEATDISIKETESLIKEWHNKTELINYALCPRFAISCTQEILEFSQDMQKSHGLLVHTHASESLEEITLVKKLTGMENIEYFNSLNLLNEKTIIVHGVHIKQHELKMIIDNHTPLVHCPGSNLKLASGIAPMELYKNKGITIGIGADGAPCNNSLDAILEVRLAALLQKPKFGPEAMAAKFAFEMLTIGGAKLLGMQEQLGSLEVGKLADITVIDRSHPSVCTVNNPYSAIVYSCSGRDIKHVFINGKQVVKNKKCITMNEDLIKNRALKQKKLLLNRM